MRSMPLPKVQLVHRHQDLKPALALLLVIPTYFPRIYVSEVGCTTGTCLGTEEERVRSSVTGYPILPWNRFQ